MSSIDKNGMECQTYILNRVRASQGHSVRITAEMLGRQNITAEQMPTTLAHGTKAALVNQILREGLIPGGRKSARNEVYLAALDPLDVKPNAELPGFRSGSEVLVLINGKEAAKRLSLIHI